MGKKLSILSNVTPSNSPLKRVRNGLRGTPPHPPLVRGGVMPDHVAIIPDGNRRWARARGKHTFFGHKRGFDLVPKLVRMSRDLGIHTTTLWAFSTENWNRSREEIAYLMKMYEGMIKKKLREAHKDKAKIVHLGRKDRIPKSLLKAIANAEEETRDYKDFILNVALDYGGHDEINRAITRLVSELMDKKTEKQKMTHPSSMSRSPFSRRDNVRPWEEIVGKYGGKYPIYGLANYMDTAGQPYPFPDLMIRTSGEHRTSGLLTWQSAYTEFYFAEVHFPDFDVDQFAIALREFSRRRRRFGGNDAGEHLKFDPKKVSKLELSGWLALKSDDHNMGRNYFRKYFKELYGEGNGLTDAATRELIKAWDDLEKGKLSSAEKNWADYLEQVRQMTGFSFNPEELGKLQVKLENMLMSGFDLDRSELESLMVESISEQFRINRLQASKAGHLRALAMVELFKDDKRARKWGEEYLMRSYRALKEQIA